MKTKTIIKNIKIVEEALKIEYPDTKYSIFKDLQKMVAKDKKTVITTTKKSPL